MNIIDIISWIIVIYIVSAFISSIRNSGNRSDNSSGIKQRMKLNYTCPYCGYSGQTYKDPTKGDSGYHFRCNDCRREFGDVNRMTAAEKRSMEAVNQECNQIDNMPELGSIMKCVIGCMEHSSRDKLNMIVFQKNENNMEIQHWEAGLGTKIVTLITLTNIYSAVGIIHISARCMEYYKKQHPNCDMYIKFEFMEKGFSWEKKRP